MSDTVAAGAVHAAHGHHEEIGFWRTYVFSTDHKMIGRQFLFLGLFMLLIGGTLAMMIRWELAWPETAVPGFSWIPEPYMYEGIIPPQTYNALFTMHATIMIFFVVMPIMVGCFGNFLIPLMIGTRDMAFPKLNMLSFWVGAVSGVVMLASFLVPGGPAASGWTGYATLSARAAYTGVGLGQDLWIIGHPEVYVLVLPAMGVTSELLSTFSRKPIFGYHAMAFSMIAIAFLSWIVWGHHMFVSGMNPLLGTAFMMTTMVIAVPSAIKVFNWLGTLWGGSIRLTSPMLFALGFVSNFLIGGLSGIFMASTPVDIFIHDTYYIVAHFHYVVAGIIFALFAAVYYWFPKMFGRMMNEKLGKIHFVLTYIFFNGAFFPMHFLGVGGHMRRIYNPTQYEFLQPMQHWNVFITISALILGASQIFFLVNFFWSLFAGKKAERNPWQANTLEWSAPTPPPHGNFEVQPVVYRGPYEYSSPEVKEDWLPQDKNLGAGAVARGH